MWKRQWDTSLILKHRQQGKFTYALLILIGLLEQTKPRSPVRNPLYPHYYPLTQAAPKNEYITIHHYSLNKRSTLQFRSSFILKTLNFKHIKRPRLLSGFDTWALYQKSKPKFLLRLRNGILFNRVRESEISIEWKLKRVHPCQLSRIEIESEKSINCFSINLLVVQNFI